MRHARQFAGEPARRTLTHGEYYGHVVGHQHSAGLRLTEVRHAQGVSLPEHTHESAYFCLLLDGTYREVFGSSGRTYQPFSFAFCPAAFRHRDEIGAHGGRFFTVEMDATWISSFEVRGRATEAPTEVRDARAFTALLHLYGEFRRTAQASRPVDNLAAESLVAELLARALALPMPGERRAPPWLASVVDQLESGYTDPLRVSTLAAIAGVHPVHLARVFRERQRCTIAEYRTGVRIRHACALLGVGEFTLAQIALRTGFADQSHLTRAFRATTGYSPAAFRRLTFPGTRLPTAS